jgi:alcohol dehydrogenase
MMKALVYGGPGTMEWTDVALPEMHDARDAIVRVDAVTICGTDLHILKGDVPEVVGGRILGHEAVGTILEVGDAVTGIPEGSRVLVSRISGCGRCRFCRTGAYGQCLEGGGWVLGHLIDGTQAEYVRVPFADLSLHLIPDMVSDPDALMLADIMPTAYEVGVLNGRVSPADTVVVVGAGPIGLAAIKTARLFSPARVIAIDLAVSRLEAAKLFGADTTILASADPEGVVTDLTEGLGADVVIEAVGAPEMFELCTRLVRAGGHVANIGVHGKPVSIHLEDLWIKNVTMTTGLVDTYSTPTLMSMLATGQLDTASFVTHHFAMEAMIEAYDVFSRASDTGALKVVLTRS